MGRVEEWMRIFVIAAKHNLPSHEITSVSNRNAAGYLISDPEIRLHQRKHPRFPDREKYEYVYSYRML